MSNEKLTSCKLGPVLRRDFKSLRRRIENAHDSYEYGLERSQNVSYDRDTIREGEACSKNIERYYGIHRTECGECKDKEINQL